MMNIWLVIDEEVGTEKKGGQSWFEEGQHVVDMHVFRKRRRYV